MRVVVLGAGIIGVTSAWFLSRAGYQVSVIERQSASALETSFAKLAPARIAAVRMLPVIDCDCGERFGVDLASFAAQVTAAEAAARAARRRPRA